MSTTIFRPQQIQYDKFYITSRPGVFCAAIYFLLYFFIYVILVLTITNVRKKPTSAVVWKLCPYMMSVIKRYFFVYTEIKNVNDGQKRELVELFKNNEKPFHQAKIHNIVEAKNFQSM